MKRIRICVLLVTGLAAWAAELTAQDLSDTIYDESTLATFTLTMNPADWDKICNDPAGQGDQWHRADMTWQGESVPGVGVKASYTGNGFSTPKPPIRLSFNEFEHANPAGPGTPGRKWRGVNRIKLDAMNVNEDHSMMRDRIAYWAYRQFGVPAPRSCHARLYVNGDYKGVYEVEEPIRKDFVRYRWGEDGGNLYNINYNTGAWGTYDWRGRDPASYVPRPFDAETNYPGGDYSDVVTLCDVLNNVALERRRAELDARIVDADRFLNYMAVLVATADGDCIVARWGGANNHFWYHRADTNRLDIIAWDPGASLGLYDEADGYPKGEVPIWTNFDNTRATPWIRDDDASRDIFRRKLLQVADGPFSRVNPKIDSVYNQIRQAVAEDPYKPMSTSQFDAARDWLKDWFVRRVAYLRSQLGSTPRNGATFVSQNVPSTMTAGQTYTVSVTLKNTGTTPWADGTTNPHRLGSQNPTDNTTWGANRIALNPGESVAPDQDKTFTWTVTAPATAGTYNFQWQMRQSGVEWFGDFTTNVAVTVTTTGPPPPPPDGADDAAFVDQEVPTTMVAGQTYSVRVTMRNTGSSTWTAADPNPHRLGSQNPQDNMTWGMNRVPMEAGATVTPGQTKAFSWNVTAPSTPGTYDFQWQMRQSGVGWFGDRTTNVSVTVHDGVGTGPVTVSFQDGVNGYTGARDTYISEGNPTSNFGASPTLRVDGDEVSGSDLAALLKWNLPSLPAGSVIQSATITLNVTNPSAEVYEVYEVKRDFSSSQATWNQYAAGGAWLIAGAQGSLDRGATVLGTLAPAAAGSYALTLNSSGVAVVQSWVDSPGTNFGIIIANGSNADGVEFASREAANVADRPALTMTYIIGGVRPPPDGGGGDGGGGSGGHCGALGIEALVLLGVLRSLRRTMTRRRAFARVRY